MYSRLMAAWVMGVVGSFFLPIALPWLLMAAGLCLLWVVWWIRRAYSKHYHWLWCVIVMLFGAVYGQWRTEAALARQWPVGSAVATTLTITVDGLPERNAKRVRFRALAHTPEGKHYRLMLADYRLRDWPIGSQWKVSAKIRAPIGERNPTGFDREAWALVQGIDGRGSVGVERQLVASGRLNMLQTLRFHLQQRWQRFAESHTGQNVDDMISAQSDAYVYQADDRERGDPDDFALPNHSARNSLYPIHVHQNTAGETSNAAQLLLEETSKFSDGVALMRALGLGEQAALPIQAWQSFRLLGLNHLVSISGLHVGMVALLAGWLMRMVLLCLPMPPRRPRVWILAIGVSVGFVYAALSGFAVPTQRSVLMLAVFAWVWWRYGEQHIWQAWWGVLAMILAWDPFAALSAGTWLSFGIVAGLMAYSACRMQRVGENRVVWWVEWWRVQAVAFLVSLPLLSVWFHSLPVLAWPVNLIAVPWFSWVLVPLALLASLFPWQPLQLLAAWLGEYTMRALYTLAEVAPEWPLTLPPVLLTALAVLAIVIFLLPRGWHLKPLAVVILCAWLLYRPANIPEGYTDVRVWDVGQGLSVSVQTANYTLLYDTGSAAATELSLLPNLRAMGIKQLNGLVLSHHDSDHDGGYAAVAKALNPQTVWAGQPEFYHLSQPCREAQWSQDGVVFEWLNIDQRGDGDNQMSCVLRIIAGDQALLITGDLTQRGEAALVKQYGTSLASQVLVLGHHGSDSSSSGAFLNVVDPDYAVASSGFANAYGHPAAAVRLRVRAHRIQLLRTDQQGGWRIVQGEGKTTVEKMVHYPKYWQRKPFDDK